MNPLKNFAYHFSEVLAIIPMPFIGIFDFIIALTTWGKYQPNNLCPYHAWIGEKLDWFLENENECD